MLAQPLSDSGYSFMQLLDYYKESIDNLYGYNLVDSLLTKMERNIAESSESHPNKLWNELWVKYGLKHRIPIDAMYDTIYEGRNLDDPYFEIYKVAALAQSLLKTPIEKWGGLVQVITNQHTDLMSYFCDTKPQPAEYIREVIPNSYGTLINNLGATNPEQLYGQLADGRLRISFREVDLNRLKARIHNTYSGHYTEGDKDYFRITPTLESWLNLHKEIYSSNYPWAGQVRSVGMCKYWNFRCHNPDDPNIDWERVKEEEVKRHQAGKHGRFVLFTHQHGLIGAELQKYVISEANKVFEHVRREFYTLDGKPILASEEDVDEKIKKFAKLVAPVFIALNQLHITREGASATNQIFLNGLAMEQGLEIDWSSLNKIDKKRVDGIIAFTEAIGLDSSTLKQVEIDDILSIATSGDPKGTTDIMQDILRATLSAFETKEFKPVVTSTPTVQQGLKDSFQNIRSGKRIQSLPMCALGIDMGGTKVAYSLYEIGDDGKIVDPPIFSAIEPSASGQDNVANLIGKITVNTIIRARDEGYKLSSIGIAAPSGTQILNTGNKSVADLTKEVLPEDFPVIVMNDGKAQAMGCIDYAYKVDKPDIVGYIGVGTGTAGGFAKLSGGTYKPITDGQIWNIKLPLIDGIPRNLLNREGLITEDGFVSSAIIGGRKIEKLLGVSTKEIDMRPDLLDQHKASLQTIGKYLANLVIALNHGNIQKIDHSAQWPTDDVAAVTGIKHFILSGGVLGGNNVGKVIIESAKQELNKSNVDIEFTIAQNGQAKAARYSASQASYALHRGGREVSCMLSEVEAVDPPRYEHR